MRRPSQLYRVTTLLLSLAMVGIGVALVAITLAQGGGPAAKGVLVGVLFAVAGGARLYIQSRVSDG